MSYTVDFQSGGVETNPSIPGKTSIELASSVINSTSTTLTLTGKGVPNYGEIQQENFIRLLENFASKTAPLNPTIGQVWFDSTASALKVYAMDQQWHSVGGTSASNTEPGTPQEGDLWYDLANSVLKVWNGTEWIAVNGGVPSGTAPTNPTIGQLWFDMTNNILKVWDGSQWVAVGSGGIAAGPTPPSGAPEGTLWYSTNDRILYIKQTLATVDGDHPLYYTDWTQAWPPIVRYANYNEYNTFAARINKVIGAPQVSGSASDVADNQWGWGQTDLLEIFSNMNTPSAFDNTKWTILESRLRKALRHTTTAETTVTPIGLIQDGRGAHSLATAYTPTVDWKSGFQGYGIVSLGTFHAAIDSGITSLETNRFNVNAASMQITNLHSDQTQGATWASTRVLDVVFQFTSHDAARTYFNQGGTVRFIVTLASGSNVGFEWYNLIHNNNIDTNGIIIDHKGIKVGTGYTGAYTNGASSVGFYDLTNSFVGMYSVTRGGAYGSGSLVVSGKYDSSLFQMTIRLSFNEDFAAGQSINKLTCTTDARTSVASISGTPYINSPAAVLPVVTTSGTFLTAGAGT